MAWEIRGSKSYYYRSQREGNKVRRIYCGTGDAGKRAAAEHEKAKAERKARQDAEKEEAKECRYAQLLLKAAIALYKLEALKDGWHQPKGVWRKINSRTRQKHEMATCTTPGKNTPNLSPKTKKSPEGLLEKRWLPQ